MSIDRYFKTWALRNCEDPYHISSFFSCHLSFNRGISWSLFHFEDEYLFFLVTSAVILVTGFLAYSAYDRYVKHKLILGELMVITGSISNIIDRFTYAGVIDFLQFHYGAWSFPVFNGADVAVVIGVLCMAWEYYHE